MKNIALLFAFLTGPLIPSIAQTATTPVATPATSDSSLAGLVEWLATQQAQVGTSIGFNSAKTKYVTTWWDAVSWGTAGLNVGAAGSLDLVDIGAGTALANGAATRYGLFLPIHAANIWNAAAAHSGSNLKLASVPNAVIFMNFLYPTNGRLMSCSLKTCGQAGVAYRFGGSN